MTGICPRVESRANTARNKPRDGWSKNRAKSIYFWKNLENFAKTENFQ